MKERDREKEKRRKRERKILSIRLFIPQMQATGRAGSGDSHNPELKRAVSLEWQSSNYLNCHLLPLVVPIGRKLESKVMPGLQLRHSKRK